MYTEILINQNKMITSKIEKIFTWLLKMLLRWPGVEPGSTAWKEAMLTAIPPTLDINSINFQELMVKLNCWM